MPSADQLRAALLAIDANALIAQFVADKKSLESVAKSCELVSVWANSLQTADAEGCAPAFLAEMQRSSHDVAALIALALYVPAAAAMRAVCETALYYTYFRQHPAELETLVMVPDFFLTKADILEFHKQHSACYRKVAKDLGFPGKLDTWYSKISAIVHGQLPGTWGRRVALKETKHESKVLAVVVETFAEGVAILNLFFLLTVGVELWDRFHHNSKKMFLRGLSTQYRSLLGLSGKV